MKIAIITSGILPVPATQGGAVENLIEFYLAENEKRQMHDITVYSIYDKKVESSELYKSCFQFIHFSYINDKSIWYRIKRKFFWRVYKKSNCYYNHYIEYFLFQVKKRLKRKFYDIIIFENRPGYALEIHKLCPKARLVLHLHNDLLNYSTPHAFEIKSVLSKIITVSDFIKNRVDTIECKINTEVCLNGIDLNAFQGVESRLILRNKLGFNENDFIIVFSGRVIPEKGVKELFQAFSKIAYNSKIKLLVIGGSFFGNTMEENDYICTIKDLSIQYKHQIVFTGFVSYDRIPSLLKCADVGIIPSIWDDPCPLVCLEEMAAGLPLIVTDSGGIPELVNEKCAIIINRKDNISDVIANSIKYLYNNPSLRTAMSIHSLERSLSFSKEKFSSNFYKLIES